MVECYEPAGGCELCKVILTENGTPIPGCAIEPVTLSPWSLANLSIDGKQLPKGLGVITCVCGRSYDPLEVGPAWKRESVRRYQAKRWTMRKERALV